jgi:hypothetical protein
MKKYMMAIVIIVVGLLVAYCVFDDSAQALKKAEQGYKAEDAKVENLRSQREASSNQIIALNRSVKDSVDFLAKWKSYYQGNRDYEAIISHVAEKTHCAVVGRKWETKKINLGKLDYDTDAFTGIVVGDYRDILRFIGEMESQLQLSTIWSMKFEQSSNDVSCTLSVYLPVFEFWGGAL